MNNDDKEKKINSNTVGKSLKTARENLGWSQEKVSKKLCLKVSTIQDIENNYINSNLDKTFLYGYIRSYARLVKLTDKNFLVLIENNKKNNFNKIKSTSNFKKLIKYKKKDIWLIRITWILFFIIIILTGMWWWKNYHTNNKDILNYKNLFFHNSSQNF
ncbi:yfgA [Wigglesworthia glossinidia endosymbiont of Glossina brevipalpis]|uniref:YfgA protein n=1 Tax=Wigglesworthia glossinidia brevipalpis TaxID=36870 RepID=Q8D1Y4_WIGBR|nr:yfgA [Wigglesworthia glossinidia endosymbiont of Glossina brevipalpis]